MAPETLLIGAAVFVFGALVGSFLNVCILRLPENQSIVFPASHCWTCKKPIAWYDNIPVASYLVLGGKCRACKKAISAQYPIIEAVTGALSVVFWLRYGLTPVGGVYLVFVLALLVQSVIDWRYRIIPDEITLPGMVLGLIASFALPQLHGQATHGGGLLRSFLGLLAGGGFLWAVGTIAEKILKKEAMGGGDVKLLGLIGAVLGPLAVFWTIFVSSIIGSIVGIYYRIRRGDEAIPFGPFLAIAAFSYLFIGPACIQAYLHALGRG
jgi:leader peptidase (prepilin peptidase)/N-methyltransferase